MTEWGEHCVSMFSGSGDKIRSFGTYGSQRGQMINPLGVAVDTEGNILVADSGNHRIQKFSSEGEALTAIGHSQLQSPHGIACSDKIYVADAHSHRVLVLNPDLTIAGTFGKEGSGKGRFCKPCGVACDSAGKVYVADQGNNRIQVFTAEGKFLSTIGGLQGAPCGVAIDNSGMVYVSEFHNSCVSVFTQEGELVKSFGLLSPGGLAVDNCGVVYVCDCNCNQVHLF